MLTVDKFNTVILYRFFACVSDAATAEQGLQSMLVWYAKNLKRLNKLLNCFIVIKLLVIALVYLFKINK